MSIKKQSMGLNDFLCRIPYMDLDLDSSTLIAFCKKPQAPKFQSLLN